MDARLRLLKDPPKIIENPQEELKRINKKIALSAEIGKTDNETIENYQKRTAGYFAIKRRCVQQLNNEGEAE